MNIYDVPRAPTKDKLQRYLNANPNHDDKGRFAAGTSDDDYIGYHKIRADEELAKGNIAGWQSHRDIQHHYEEQRSQRESREFLASPAGGGYAASGGAFSPPNMDKGSKRTVADLIGLKKKK